VIVLFKYKAYLAGSFLSLKESTRALELALAAYSGVRAGEGDARLRASLDAEPVGYRFNRQTNSLFLIYT